MAKQLTLLSFLFLLTIGAPSHTLAANRSLQDALDFDNLPPNQITKLQLIADDHWNSYAGRNAMEILNLYYDGQYDIDPMISSGAKNSKRSGGTTNKTLTVLRVYPNPASDYVIVEVSQEFAKPGQTVVAVDSNGKRVYQISLQNASQQMTLDVGQWAAGNYQISLLQHDRVLLSQQPYMWFIKIHYLQRRLIVSASFIVLSLILSAQGGFNLRMPIEGNTVFQSVHIGLDSTFIVAGWSLDTNSNNHLDFELLKIGISGQTLLNRSINNPTQVTNEQQNTISYVPDFFAQFEQAYLNSEYAQRLFFFNSNLDTLRSVFVQSPWKDSTWEYADFMFSQSLAISADSCTFYSFGIANTNVTANDFCIKKFSPSGDELWTYIQSTEADPDECFALRPTDDGGVIAAVFEASTEDEPSKNKLIRLDSNGNPTWTLNSPGGYDSKFINCIIGDGSDIVISGRHVTPNITSYTTIAIVVKLDTLGNTHWARTYGEYEEFRRKDFTNVVKTCDGNYVTGGTWVSTPGSEEIPDGQNDQDVDEFAYLLKLDRETGDIIWERKYRFLEIYGDRHNLIDMKATFDGGVIFCGVARDSYQILDGPYQQGWLVKLDECGCLVPGCDSLCNYVGCASNDTTAFFPAVAHQFIVGPNPATQFINIYFAGGDLDLAQTQFQMYDLQGRLVYSFAPDATDTTFMLSTEQFASGTYLLHLSHNGAKVQEQKIVVVGR